jgi:hypothetical protein
MPRGLAGLILSAALLLAPAVAGAQPVPEDWGNYADRESGFTIDFPAQPNEETKVEVANGVSLKTTYFTVRTVSGSYALTVTRTADLPPAEAADPEKFVEDVIAGSVGQEEILTKRRVRVPGGVALEAIHRSGGRISRTQVQFVPPYVYILVFQAEGENGAVAEDEAPSRFFNSLRARR